MKDQLLMHDARKLHYTGLLRGVRVVSAPLHHDKFQIDVVADPAVVDQYAPYVTRQRGGPRLFSSIDAAATTIRDIGFRDFHVHLD